MKKPNYYSTTQSTKSKKLPGIAMLTDKLAICEDGEISLVLNSEKLIGVLNILKQISNDKLIMVDTKNEINKVIKMLSYNKQSSSIKRLFNQHVYKKANDKNEHCTQAFKAYYTYFSNMKITKIVVLQKSKNDIIVLIYDKSFIYRFNILNPSDYNFRTDSYGHGGFRVTGLWIYDINSNNIKNTLFKINNDDDCYAFINIQKIMLWCVQNYIKEVKTNLGEKALSKNIMKVESRPPINDIFNVVADAPDKYIYFQYGQKIKCSSSYVLTTLKML